MNGSLMHEGQMIDSRMNINSLLTASVEKFHPGMKGATLANYIEMLELTKSEDGKITGAVLKDNLSDKTFPVKAKVVINCTGIFADQVRKMDNKEAKPRIKGSKGTHLMLKNENGMFPMNTGMIIP